MKIIDMHCDTLWEIDKKRSEGKECSLRENNLHMDLMGMKKSGYMVQNFAMYVNLGKFPDPWEQTLNYLNIFEEELAANRDMIRQVFGYKDILQNERDGLMSALLTMEEGGVCGGDTERLRFLYEKGVRMVTLTWNFPNGLGFPNLDSKKGEQTVGDPQAGRVFLNTPDTCNGLTEKGKEFVVLMEKLGMIPDVSHMSDAGFWDVAACTKKPFAASHSNARAICPCVRNLTDEMIRTLGERGGVTGLNYCADFLKQPPIGEANPGTVEDIVRHARHIVNVGGIQVLGLGSDFDGIRTHEELPGAAYMDRLYDGLLKGGFTASQADLIFYGNVLRLYKDCLA